MLKVAIIAELLVGLVLAFRFHFDYALTWREAAWSGLFHAVSAFNNAGFSTHADSVMRYAPAACAAAIDDRHLCWGIGFPVLLDMRTKLRSPRSWSLHKLTLAVTAVLLMLGFIGVLIFEWNNFKTLGAMTLPNRILSAAVASVSARTAGFNSVDFAVASVERRMSYCYPEEHPIVG